MKTVNTSPIAGNKELLPELLAEWALEKKAINPVVMDVRQTSGLCDYFVICSADNSRQVEAICDEIKKKCKENKIIINHIEKDDSPQWALIDMVDVIFHVFTADAREFYNLEYLWRLKTIDKSF